MSRKYQKPLVYLSLLIIPFLFLLIRPQAFSSFKLGVVNWTTTPLKIIFFPLKEIKKILYYHRIYNEYVRLRQEVDTLRSRLIGVEEVLRENTRFEKLLDFKRKLIFSSVPANVIARDPTNWNASIIIDKGSKEGIGQGMPVVTAAGVVGKVAEVGSSYSRVIVLTDPQFSVPAILQTSRESGLISGSLQGLCRLRYLSSAAEVQIGDKVITSKLSSSFPEGLLIGEIVDAHGSPDRPEGLEFVVQPAVALSKLEEVLVIQK